MASWQKKVKKGREYWYIMESARVNGKPRIVKQIYVGSAERVAEFVRRMTEGPDLNGLEIEHRAWGKPMALFSMAQRLHLTDLVNEVFGEKKTGYDIGEMVVAAAIHRACDPDSKQSLPDWYRKTSLPTKTGWNIPEEWFSQNWWNNLYTTTIEQVHRLQLKVLERIKEEFGIEMKLLLYDPTNFSTYINRHHINPDNVTLPMFGKSKRGRKDLLQVNFALIGTADGGIPLMSHTYEGNISDMTIFGDLVPHWPKEINELSDDPEKIPTVVFDRGNLSKENLQALLDDSRFVCTLKPSLFKDLVHIPLDTYTEPELLTSRAHRLKVWKGLHKVYGEELPVVMTYNESSAERERQTFEERYERQWKIAQEYIDNSVHPGNVKDEEKVRRKLNKELLRYYDFKGLTEATIVKKKGRGANGKLVVKLTRNDEKIRYHLDKMGKQIMLTNQRRWKSRQVVRSMTSMWRVEDLFRKLKASDYLSTQPMYHWTDSMIIVHHMVVVLAMQMMTLAYREVCHAELDEWISFDQMWEELDDLQEELLMFPKEKQAHRVISKRSDLQEHILGILGLDVE